ncbi:hypothetical protein [Streptomyces goshikiensis]
MNHWGDVVDVFTPGGGGAAGPVRQADERSGPATASAVFSCPT